MLLRSMRSLTPTTTLFLSPFPTTFLAFQILFPAVTYATALLLLLLWCLTVPSFLIPFYRSWFYAPLWLLVATDAVYSLLLRVSFVRLVLCYHTRLFHFSLRLLFARRLRSFPSDLRSDFYYHAPGSFFVVRCRSACVCSPFVHVLVLLPTHG